MWAGNIYQKFEEMCLEVEEVMYEVYLPFPPIFRAKLCALATISVFHLVTLFDVYFTSYDFFFFLISVFVFSFFRVSSSGYCQICRKPGGESWCKRKEVL